MKIQSELSKGQSAKSILIPIMMIGFVLSIACYPRGCFAGTNKKSYEIKTSVSWLSSVMDQFHNSYDIYTDAFAAGNHFSEKVKINSFGDDGALPNMDEFYGENPHSGQTCIKATFKSQGSNWGGWYFMNAVPQGDNQSFIPNSGDVPNAGVDIRGASRLTFWARGKNGEEHVEFFAFGIGRKPNDGSPIKPYPDSSQKISLGYVNLSKEWGEYSIDLTKQDLSYVLCGFGWVTNALVNNRKDITFYIDDIRYNKSRNKEPHFL